MFGGSKHRSSQGIWETRVWSSTRVLKLLLLPRFAHQVLWFYPPERWPVNAPWNKELLTTPRQSGRRWGIPADLPAGLEVFWCYKNVGTLLSTLDTQSHLLRRYDWTQQNIPKTPKFRRYWPGCLGVSFGWCRLICQIMQVLQFNLYGYDMLW